MMSFSNLSQLGFKQLSVHLVDCMKTPTDLRLDLKQESKDDNLVLKEISFCLVDCKQTLGLNGQVIHQEAEENYSSIKVDVKEEKESEDGIKVLNPELSHHLHWLGDTETEIILYKEVSECDDRHSNWGETKAEEIDELEPSHMQADEILLVLEEDSDSAEGVMWLSQGYKVSECCKSTTTTDQSGGTEDCRDPNPTNSLSVDITKLEEHDAEEDDEDERQKSSGPATGEKYQQQNESKPKSHQCEHCGKSFASVFAMVSAI
ncbi:hypothetical protein Q5P01_002913 [Channa striata]|uniref:Uncharacterized protein n=1 Tax=Channa striata TaxID=64152 RepID=A0AA88NQ77_CHASR|nr:hypothetical protein Q5P01_002913 [Channa striata]